MKIYIASDHAGFEMKGTLIEFVRSLGHDVEDFGASSLDPADDYPTLVMPLARRVAAEKGSVGIVLGASGQGEAMAANRISGARAAVYYGETGTQTDASGNVLNLLQSARAHNDANILALGARFISEAVAQHAVQLFLDTSFSGDERHMRRIAQLDA